ncbi:MAG: hypothetical protein WC073_05665 [Sterolibacterium sp.]
MRRLRNFLRRRINRHFADLLIARWRKSGAAPPPPHGLKQRVIEEYRIRYGLGTFVETGTFRGDMVAAMLGRFDEIFSIEVFEPVYRQAAAEFGAYPHVHIVLGDSAEVMPGILSRLKSPALFWLDGHYSGAGTGRGGADTPVMAELNHIAGQGRPGQVVLIDDARLFIGENGYPSLEQVRAWAMSHGFASCEVDDDIIRLH